MKEAVVIRPGCLEFREVPEPKAGPGQVVIRVMRIGVCGSDIHVWHGKHPFVTYPLVQGHEYAGVVGVRCMSALSPWPIQRVRSAEGQGFPGPRFCTGSLCDRG
jgi:hypothetical protein